MVVATINLHTQKSFESLSQKKYEIYPPWAAVIKRLLQNNGLIYDNYYFAPYL